MGSQVGRGEEGMIRDLSHPQTLGRFNSCAMIPPIRTLGWVDLSHPQTPVRPGAPERAPVRPVPHETLRIIEEEGALDPGV